MTQSSEIRKIATIVMPVYNGEDYLKYTLPQLKRFIPENVDLVVVDDGSTDNSFEIAKSFTPQVIRLDRNMGHPNARNHGFSQVDSDIYIALDADVLIQHDTIQKILETFEDRSDVSAVTGLLSDTVVGDSFFSDYKNLYMNYTFMNCPEEINFLYGSIHAVRKKDMLSYRPDVGRTDDTDLGMRLFAKGKKILLLKNVQVQHLKKYDFLSLLKNDFFIPFDWTKVFLNHFSFKKILNQKGFAHSKFEQLTSISVAFFAYVLMWITTIASGKESKLFLISKTGSLCLVFLWILLNQRFFKFLYQKRNLVFAIKAIFFTFIDQVVMFSGVAVGFMINGVKFLKNRILPTSGELHRRF